MAFLDTVAVYYQDKILYRSYISHSMTRIKLAGDPPLSFKVIQM